MNKLSVLFFSVFTFISCTKTNVNFGDFSTITISLQTHKLVCFSIIKNTNYLIVFEIGLGQAQEDLIYTTFFNSNGADFGATMEARELIEDSHYMATLPNVPNVPVIVLTSMKVDALHNAANRQNWFNAHELLKAGITDFTHISTTKSGHYIFIEEPDLVLENLNLFI